jgi:hypothetical protein
MQTFVPIASTNFADIAKVLDNKRLNKQALEGWQIMMNLLQLDPAGDHRVSKGWSNHPAVKMWKGHEQSLFNYIVAMTDEWILRGYKTTIKDKAAETLRVAVNHNLVSLDKTPPTWITESSLYQEVAKSHRLALLTKDYEWYSQFNWDEDTGRAPQSYDYVWPV